MRYLILLLLLTACGTDATDKNTSAVQTALASPVPEAKDGKDGVNGKDGKDGTNGKDGVNGKDASTVDINEWYDGISTKLWTMGATDVQIHGTSECQGSFRAPTTTELSDACFRGLFKVYTAKLGALPATTSWASTSGDAVTIATCLATTQATGTQAVIVCIQK